LTQIWGEKDALEATPAQVQMLQQKTAQYRVVMQTLLQPPSIERTWATDGNPRP
jgi:hypothetical protein